MHLNGARSARLSIAAGLIGFGLTYAQPLDLAQREEFLRTAKIGKTRTLSEGITGAQIGKLSDGKVTHDASIQSIDDYKNVYTTALGTELNFKDTYKGNVAAYRLAKLLGLENMVAVSVERRVGGKQAAVTWWVDDVLMTEKERFQKKKVPPDSEKWNSQMYIVRVFDQFIYNVDRNLGNLVIDKNWNLYMIDHTRAFRLHKKLQNEQNLVKCDRRLFAALQGLSREKVGQNWNHC